MERLDACYFCGTAADAPLREVSISPRDQRGDPDATVRVTLCPTCEHKLEQVLSGLFEHVESRPTTDDGASVPRDVDTESNGEDSDTPVDDPDPIDRIDVATQPPTDEPTATTGGDDGDAEFIQEGPRVRARSAAITKESLEGVSVAEYNRVMRLLQNRAFPMARTAFVDLAASAYDLSEETVEAVLDTVIDQGALGEREGQLVREDDRSP